MAHCGVSLEYAKTPWVDAYAAIMCGKKLDEGMCKFYAKVLIIHTLSHAVLRDSLLVERNHQDELIHSFYVNYTGTLPLDKTSLLSTRLMETLVDLDPGKMKLIPVEKDYINKVLLEQELRVKDLTFQNGNVARRQWLQSYMYAITPSSSITHHVMLYSEMGLEKYREFLKKDTSIAEGSNGISLDWRKFSIEQLKLLKTCMEHPEKVTWSLDPNVGNIFFQFCILQGFLSYGQKGMYWKAKISDLTKFINQASR